MSESQDDEDVHYMSAEVHNGQNEGGRVSGVPSGALIGPKLAGH